MIAKTETKKRRINSKVAESARERNLASAKLKRLLAVVEDPIQVCLDILNDLAVQHIDPMNNTYWDVVDKMYHSLSHGQTKKQSAQYDEIVRRLDVDIHDKEMMERKYFSGRAKEDFPREYSWNPSKYGKRGRYSKKDALAYEKAADNSISSTRTPGERFV